jgi:hypothetical protein
VGTVRGRGRKPEGDCITSNFTEGNVMLRRGIFRKLKAIIIDKYSELYAMLSVEFHTNTPNLPWKSSSVNPNLIISSSISLKRLLPGATRNLKIEKEKTRALLFPTNK